MVLSGTASAQPAAPVPESAAAKAGLDGEGVQLDNPAFPPARAEAAPALWPLGELLPTAAPSPLLEAAAALEAGQPATALRLLSAAPDDARVRYLARWPRTVARR